MREWHKYEDFLKTVKELHAALDSSPDYSKRNVTAVLFSSDGKITLIDEGGDICTLEPPPSDEEPTY